MRERAPIPELDAAIHREFSNPSIGMIKRLINQFPEVGSHYAQRRAQKLGYKPRFSNRLGQKKVKWTDGEVAAMEEHHYFSNLRMQRYLKSKGFQARSLKAIAKKKELMNLPAADEFFVGYTVAQVAELLSKNRMTVLRWIEAEIIESYLPEGSKGYFIKRKALLKFMLLYPARYHLSGISSVWLADLFKEHIDIKKLDDKRKDRKKKIAVPVIITNDDILDGDDDDDFKELDGEDYSEELAEYDAEYDESPRTTFWR